MPSWIAKEMRAFAVVFRARPLLVRCVVVILIDFSCLLPSCRGVPLPLGIVPFTPPPQALPCFWYAVLCVVDVSGTRTTT